MSHTNLNRVPEVCYLALGSMLQLRVTYLALVLTCSRKSRFPFVLIRYGCLREAT